MSKPIHRDAALVSQAIKAVDLFKGYNWKHCQCCLGGLWRRSDPQERHFPGSHETFMRLSNIALSVHMGLPPDATHEDRLEANMGTLSLNHPKIPWTDWEPVKEKLCQFYNLADERILEDV